MSAIISWDDLFLVTSLTLFETKHQYRVRHLSTEMLLGIVKHSLKSPLGVIVKDSDWLLSSDNLLTIENLNVVEVTRNNQSVLVLDQGGVVLILILTKLHDLKQIHALLNVYESPQDYFF